MSLLFFSIFLFNLTSMSSRFFCTGFACILMLLLSGCNNPFSGVEQHEKYQIPEGLAGKLFTQVKAEDNLTIYTSALEITGFDETFDQSGSYTLLTPTDAASSLARWGPPDTATRSRYWGRLMPVPWQVCSATRAKRASRRMPAVKSTSRASNFGAGSALMG